MEIPSKVKIGGHWFDIEYRDEKDAYTNMGSKFTWWNRIILQRDLCDSKMVSNLFHEVLHEISTQNDLDLTESQVCSVSEGFYQFLTDNGLLKAKVKSKPKE